MDEDQAVELYNTIPLPAFAHGKLLSLFHLYTLIGGMPEVIKTYAEQRNLTALQSVYEALLAAYFDDEEKYASNQSQVQLMRHAVKSVFYEAGTRINYAGFGASAYNSKEMGEALRTLEKMFLINFLFQHNGKMFPVEVKSGTSGKLRSLHQYLNASETDFAVRLFAGNIALEEHKTISGKTFKLLNLPYFLSGKLDEYLDYYQ
jgi:hypothetical protein